MRPFSRWLSWLIVATISILLIARTDIRNRDLAHNTQHPPHQDQPGNPSTVPSASHLSEVPMRTQEAPHAEVNISAAPSETHSEVSSAEIPTASTEADTSKPAPNLVDVALQRARSNPGFATELLYQAIDIPDKARQLPLVSAITALILFDEQGAKIERTIVENALNPATPQRQAWAELLSETGARSSAARQQVLDYLYLGESRPVLADLVQSLLPVEARPDEALAVLAQLTPLLDHPDEQVRAATIRKVAMWGDENQISNLELALQDVSNEVRHAAAAAAMMSELRSDTVRILLLQIMNNDAEPEDTRTQAYYALDNYTLSAEERAQIKSWESRFDEAEAEPQ